MTDHESAAVPRLTEAGDSALVLELEPRIDEEVNARAIATASRIRAAVVPGVRDVVPTYRSVAVYFDPLLTRLETVVDLLRQTPDLRTEGSSRLMDVPVAYGGAYGPDLPDVASQAGLSEAEVVRRHAAVTYRVFMMGFVPGFAYMGTVDEAIAVPRHTTPRTKVPAGSVGIAGRQTGIYPQETPGGWQLIGRTALRPFDPERTPPVLFEAGDRVRFHQVPALPQEESLSSPSRLSGATVSDAGVTVVRPGLLTTVQDRGRWGHQHRGVPVGGSMDLVAHRSANGLVGNDADAATLEITLIGPEVRFERAAVFALGGADLDARLDGRRVQPGRAVAAAGGDVLRFGARQSGTRTYLAVAGGFDVPQVLGSRATHLVCGIGGVAGRPLMAGDRLPVGQIRRQGGRGDTKQEIPRGGARLRVLPGPQDDFFDAAGFETLERTRFSISPQSNRMAYRLSGGPLPRLPGREMISDAMMFGGIQVPPSGEPILLMADRPTSGGYPQIATVITADLPLAAQLAPGDWVEFRACTRREAMAALLAQESRFLGSR